MNKEDKYSLGYLIGKSIQENKDKKEKLEKQNIRFKKKNKQLKTQLDIANKKIDKLDNEIKSVINIIKQQPSNDDEWILGRLNGFLSIIGGE